MANVINKRLQPVMLAVSLALTHNLYTRTAYLTLGFHCSVARASDESPAAMAANVTESDAITPPPSARLRPRATIGAPLRWCERRQSASAIFRIQFQISTH